MHCFCHQDGNQSDVLDILESVVSKRILIKTRRSDWNLQHPNSSVSVSQFIMCDDLMGQFDNAELGSLSGGNSSIGGSVRNRKVLKYTYYWPKILDCICTPLMS